MSEGAPQHDDRWYAIHVRAQRERSVSSILTNNGYKVYLPTTGVARRWSDKVKIVDHPLFPGYLFCSIDSSCQSRVVTTPGVIGVVGNGRKWIQVDSSEIDAVRALVSSGAKAEAWPFLSEGDRVRIEWGPMRGLEGLLLNLKSGTRLVVSVTLLRRSVAVEIDRVWVRPA